MGPGGPLPFPHLILGEKKKKRIAEGRKAGGASDKKPGPPLSSKSGSATAHVWQYVDFSYCVRQD